MKIILLLLSFTILASETCDKKKKKEKDQDEIAVVIPPIEQGNVPTCVQAKIDSIKKIPRFNPPAEVNEYLYKGKKVFLFSSDCCDQFNLMFDENCKYICAPTGGITGIGDTKCADFSNSAQHVKLVWKDPR